MNKPTIKSNDNNNKKVKLIMNDCKVPHHVKPANILVFAELGSSIINERTVPTKINNIQLLLAYQLSDFCLNHICRNGVAPIVPILNDNTCVIVAPKSVKKKNQHS